MKQLAAALVVILEIILIAFAVNGVLGGLWGLSANPLFDQLPVLLKPGTAWEARFYWAALLLLPIAHWIILAGIARRRRAISLKTTGSESLLLYESAITQYVGGALTEIPAVIGHRVSVKQVGRHGISMTILVTLKPVERVIDIQEQIEKTVRRHLTHVLGIEKIDRIRVIVKDFGELERKPLPALQEIAIQARPEAETSLAPAPREPEAIEVRPQEIRLAPPPPGPEPVDFEAAIEAIETPPKDEGGRMKDEY